MVRESRLKMLLELTGVNDRFLNLTQLLSVQPQAVHRDSPEVLRRVDPREFPIHLAGIGPSDKHLGGSIIEGETDLSSWYVVAGHESVYQGVLAIGEAE